MAAPWKVSSGNIEAVDVPRAELARVRGDAAARERELREAIRLFRSIGALARADRLETDLAS